jgi:hypothetical protein
LAFGLCKYELRITNYHNEQRTKNQKPKAKDQSPKTQKSRQALAPDGFGLSKKF